MKNIFSMGGQSAVPAQTKTIGNAMNIAKMKRIVLFAVSLIAWNVMLAQTEKAVNYFVPTGHSAATYKFAMKGMENFMAIDYVDYKMIKSSTHQIYQRFWQV